MSLAIRLDSEMDKRLGNLAKKTHRSKNFFVREALKQYIEDLEDYYTAETILENPGKIYTLAEVESFYV